MLRPMTNALAAVIWSISARFSSGMSANQAWSLSPQLSPPSSPNGRSSDWLRPAEYADHPAHAFGHCTLFLIKRHQARKTLAIGRPLASSSTSLSR
jgi:hypothetical protein